MMYYIFELFLLSFSFILPGFLLPPMEDGNERLNSPLNLSIYIGLAFVQLLFMLFILHRDKQIPKKIFGLVSPQLKDLLSAILFSIGLFVLYYIVISFVLMLPEAVKGVVASGFRWHLKNRYMIPLLFLFCLITGYREELLFRAYVITRGVQLGLPIPYVIVLSVFSFSVLHLYEGIIGFIFAFISGLYLAFIFVVKKNIHIVAISHGLFNFCSLLISLIEPH